MEQVIEALLLALGGYLALGAAAAAALHAKGLKAIDPGVPGAGSFFRVLVTPGLVALWPLMLLRWRRAAAGDAEPPAPDAFAAPSKTRRAHGLLAVLVGVAIPLVGYLAISARPAAMAPTMPGAGYLLREPAPGGKLVLRDAKLFAGFGASEATITEGAEGVRVLELAFDKDLLQPSLALYWLPEGGGEEKLADGVFLGSVWGPGKRRYWLPAAASDLGKGTFLVYSLAKGETVFETARP